MKPPLFLQHLYADLRDRRLLPIVGLLVVAIAAVPVLLKSKVEPPPPIAAQTSAVGETEVPTLPAVLAADPGLRDYRDRLGGLRSKDPFAQKGGSAAGTVAAVAASAALAEIAGSEAAVDAAASAAGASTASAVDTASGSGKTSTSDTAESPDSTSGSGDGNAGGGDSGSGGGSQTTTEQVAFRVDVEVGHPGDTDRRKNVKLLTVLPSQSNPVAMFLGASEDGRSAVFLISEDVGNTHGDGSCLPSAAECEFLTLKPGQQRRFAYGPEGEEFVLKLVSIGLAPVKKSSKAAPEKDEASREALSAWLGL
jgi:hypothetical protein